MKRSDNIDLVFQIYFSVNTVQRALLSRGSARRRTGGLRLFLADAIFFELSHEGSLVRSGLETSVSELGASINELQVDLLQRRPLGVHQ